MSKSLTIIISLILLVSLGIFSAVQVQKLNNTKTHLSEQLKNIDKLEESLESEKGEKFMLTDLNVDLQDENQMLRDSIVRLHEVIAKLRRKITRQDATIDVLRSKLEYLQQQYDAKKDAIAIIARKEVVDQPAIAKIETEKAVIKEQITEFQSMQNDAIAVKSEAESEMQDKLESEERFRKIVDVVNNTRIKFQDIKIKMDAMGSPVTRLITDGKNWKVTDVEFFMNHQNSKVLLDEQFMVKIIDMDYQEELKLQKSNPLNTKVEEIPHGAPFHYDGNLIEIKYTNNEPKKGKNFEVQVYYRSDDGEEYLLLDGVKQFIREGNVVGI